MRAARGLVAALFALAGTRGVLRGAVGMVFWSEADRIATAIYGIANHINEIKVCGRFHSPSSRKTTRHWPASFRRFFGIRANKSTVTGRLQGDSRSPANLRFNQNNALKISHSSSLNIEKNVEEFGRNNQVRRDL